VRISETRLRYESFTLFRSFRRIADGRLWFVRACFFPFFDLIGQISYPPDINGHFSPSAFNDIHFFPGCKHIKTPFRGRPGRARAARSFARVFIWPRDYFNVFRL
jgi:hypothetical protein